MNTGEQRNGRLSTPKTFNQEELPLEIKPEAGLKLQNALQDTLDYWYVCTSAKDVPNYLRYSVCEQITNTLAESSALMSRSVERYNYSRYMSRPENKDAPKVVYKAYDIVQDSRRAEDLLTKALYMIKTLQKRPSFKKRMSEISRLGGMTKSLMRGWLIYLSTHGGR